MILKADTANNRIVIASDFGSTNITVDGAKYQVTVKQDGSIEYKKLSTDTIDVSAIFTVSSITAVTIDSQSIIGEAGASIVKGSIDNNEITLTPVNVGTATVIISDGTRSIQAQVTVINDNGLKVTHSIPVSNYYTSTVGF